MLWKTQDWYVSPHNYAEEVVKTWSIPDEVTISDCTIRDGPSEPSVVLELDQKIEIAKKLDELGIGDIEIGIADPESEEERIAFRELTKLHLRAKTSCITLSKRMVDFAVESGVWGIRLTIPLSEEFRTSLGQAGDDKMMNDVRDRLNWIDYARSNGIYVIATMSDSTRVPLETFQEVVPILVEEGKVDRLRISDTVGAMGPFGMAYLVKHLSRIAKQTPIEIHPHGFFGLATANALAAVSAGASVVSSSFNGLSARGGNARTEEVIVGLKMLMGVNLDYIKYNRLYETSRLIQKLTGEYVPRGKAVVGDELFVYENQSGYVSGNYFDFPFSGAPYTPEFVGQTRRLVLSKKSNRMAVKTKLEQLGIKASNEQQEIIMKECIKYAHQHKRILSDNDVRDIVRKILDK